MPRIRQYIAGTSAGDSVPTRQARPQAFGSGAGAAAFAQAFDEIGQAASKYHESIERQEASDVNARLAQARADWTQNVTDRAAQAEPGDMTFAGTIRDDLDSYFNKMSEGIQGGRAKRLFQQESARLRADISLRAGAIQSKMAGEKAVRDVGVFLDANRNTLLNDPTQFESTLANAVSVIQSEDGVYGNLTREQREQLGIAARKDLAKSAVQGYIELSPEITLKQLKNGQWDEFLDADDKNTLTEQAERAKRAQEIESERLKRTSEDAEKKARESTKKEFIAKWAEGTLTTKEILHSNLEASEQEHYINLIEKANKPDTVKTDPAVFTELFERVHAEENRIDKIREPEDLDEHFGTNLTKEDLNFLRKELDDLQDPAKKREAELKSNFLRTIKSSLTGTNPLLGLRDPKGDEQYQKFLVSFQAEYDALRAAGRTPMELLDPNSPSYLGKLATPLKRSMQEQMRDLISGVGGTPPAGGLAARATRRATLNDVPIYEVDGKWVHEDGTEVQ